MKLAQGDSLNPDAPKGVADLKYGMSSVNRTGIQQNTHSLFDEQPFEDIKKKKPEPKVEPTDESVRYRKALTDQRNPYKKSK